MFVALCVLLVTVPMGMWLPCRLQLCHELVVQQQTSPEYLGQVNILHGYNFAILTSTLVRMFVGILINNAHVDMAYRHKCGDTVVFNFVDAA